MSIDITLRLDDASLLPFRQALAARAAGAGRTARSQIAAQALERYREIADRALPDYARRTLSRIPDLAALLVRTNWPLDEADASRLAGGLIYFSDPDGLIADLDTRLGLLDDVIVLELALARCHHEWLAWREYRQFAARHPEIEGLGRDDWLRERHRFVEHAMRRGEPDSYLEPPLEDAFHRESHTYLDEEVKPPFTVS